MKLEFSHNIFEKSSNIKFHENPTSWSGVVPCGQTDGLTNERRDITKLIVAILRKHLYTYLPSVGKAGKWSRNKYMHDVSAFQHLVQAYRRCRETCCLHLLLTLISLSSTLIVEEGSFSEKSVQLHHSTLHPIPKDSGHITALKTSNLKQMDYVIKCNRMLSY